MLLKLMMLMLMMLMLMIIMCRMQKSPCWDRRCNVFAEVRGWGKIKQVRHGDGEGGNNH